MKVSIIIPVYNNEGYLQECLDSVLTKTYDDIEILLIDLRIDERLSDTGLKKSK